MNQTTATVERPHRNTIVVEDAEIIGHNAFPGQQYILTVRAPRIAERAEPGSFAHIRCDTSLPMRRPLSIMRVDAERGSVEFLYKIVGDGTRLLAAQAAGTWLNIMGPIGNAFELHTQRRRPLLIGGGVGIPPMVFLADRLRKLGQNFEAFAIMGSEVPFPFAPRPSQLILPGMPDGVIAAMPLLEDWGIASRLASMQGYPGCFEGYVTQLADHWLTALTEQQRNEVEIFACGPHPMLDAAVKLAQKFKLPCQVSLEEFMACAVGGCAGCTVRVNSDEGPAMKRVCVDGPVFDGYQVCF
jgi:dihydroorotate dehydrogenase electron transfer subunit